MAGLLSMLSGAGAESPEETSADESPAALAAQGLLSAIEAKDAAGVLSAFRELMACCKADDETTEPMTEAG